MPFFEDYGQNLHYATYSSLGKKSGIFHIHPHWEFYFCGQSIEQTNFNNGKTVVYRQPLVMLSTPFSHHGTLVYPKTLHTRHLFYFGDKFLSRMPSSLFSMEAYSEVTAAFFPLTEEVAAELMPLIERMKEADKAEQALTFALIFHRIEEAVPLEKRLYIGNKNGYIQNVMHYIVDNLDRNPSVTELANHFYVGRNKLNCDFKNFTGTTVHQFVVELRLSRAKELLLEQPRQSVSDIAHLCGFGNEFYFSSFFKEHTGIAPRDYAKNRGKTQ